MTSSQTAVASVVELIMLLMAIVTWIQGDGLEWAILLGSAGIVAGLVAVATEVAE